MELAELIRKYGNVTEFLLPSGVRCAIREQDGEDDAILSNVALTKNSDAINAFIQGVTVYLESAHIPEKPPTLDDIMVRPLKDKYFILIKSRIFSLGADLDFNYTWDPEQEPVAYSEDLEMYLWDYSLPFPTKGMPGYFAERITPYTVKSPITATLSTGKNIRYKALDSYGEKYLLKLPNTERHINQKIIARELEVRVNDEWTKVSSFKGFKSRETAEIRDHIDKHDPEFSGLTTLENPYVTGEVETISIIQVQDFFFPRVI